jgi:diguanylate cyclase (GGDEF)-like protein
MTACLIVGLLRYGRPAEAQRPAVWWLRWIAGLLAADLVIAGIALSPVAAHPALRLVPEGGAVALALAGIAIMLVRRIRGPLMAMYTVSLAAFGQASLAFLLARPWDHQWWLAHTIFAAGFFLLSYGVIQAFHTTRAFATVFSQEELMRRLEEANAELTRLATTDSLTGVANRRHFLVQVAAEVRRRARSGDPLAVLTLDVDRFKTVNDTYGHQAGDDVLRAFAAALRREARAVDTVGRVGGEEFMILMPETDAAAALVAAERIRRAVEAMAVATGGHVLNITVSIGVGQFGPDGETAEAVFAVADRRLYAAKNGGRNRVVGPDA